MSKSAKHGSAAEALALAAAQGLTFATAQGLTFEKALAELEKVVAQMEDGKLTLEQSLASHKRGLELARFCQEKLASAEQQVKVLEGDVLKKLAAADTGSSEA